MAKIYLVRHGESVANTEGIYQGQTYNTPLSPVGRKQAKALAKYFAQINLNRIVASPLLRTIETASAVAVSKNIVLESEDQILETNHGEWEGLKKELIASRWKGLYQLWMSKPEDVKFPNGETFKETQIRVLNWWGQISQTKSDTLVVTHDNIIRILVTEILGLGLNNIWKFDLNPAAVTRIDVTDNRTHLVVLDDRTHLKNLLVNLGNHAL